MDRRRALATMTLAASMAGFETARAQTPSARGRLVGLSIGINDYQNLNRLQTAQQDAASIAQRLHSVGYAMEPEPEDHSTDGLVASFAQFLSKVDSSSAAFLFLAGHGVQVDGRNYYLPANIPLLDTEDALVDALPLNFFLDALAKAQPRQTIVVLDACRDDALGKALPGFSRGIASTNAPRGCFIAYSAGSGEFALDRLADDDASPNGLFTRHLLEHMQGDKRIQDIIYETKSQVREDALNIGHEQNPAIYDASLRTYFLDGIERRGSGAIADGSGTLEGTGIVLAAADDYGDLFRGLRSPKPDAVRLHRILSGLGAEVIGLLNPSRDVVLDACTSLARRGIRQHAFVWLGRGLLRDIQATGMLENGDMMGVTRSKDAIGGLEMFSHSDIVEAFRPQPEGPGGVGKAAPAPAATVPLTLFFDCGLERDEVLASVNSYSSQVPLNDVPNEFMLEDRFHDIALISSTRPGRGKPATTERDAASPFVTALINALGRPGLTMLQLSDLIESEVETLTAGEQAPVLVASPKAANRPFVRRKSA